MASSAMKIRAPEDTITQMARRAYGEFRKAEAKVGGRMAEWDDAPIRVHVTWKDIVGQSLGTRGTMVNCNPMMRDPHTLIITGLSDTQAEAMRAGIEAKLGKPMNYSDKAFESPTEGVDAEPEG
jgi:hypothetical protein